MAETEGWTVVSGAIELEDDAKHLMVNLCRLRLAGGDSHEFQVETQFESGGLTGFRTLASRVMVKGPVDSAVVGQLRLVCGAYEAGLERGREAVVEESTTLAEFFGCLREAGLRVAIEPA